MNTFKKFMKNSKAISPIFATLILIAIAVIAGVVVYMFVSGSLSSMTTGTGNVNDRLSVQGAQCTIGVSPATTAGTVIVSNTGSKEATVTGLILKDSNGNTVTSATVITVVSGANPVPASSTATLSGAWTANLVKGAQYTVTVITSGGGSFLSGAFVPLP